MYICPDRPTGRDFWSSSGQTFYEVLHEIYQGQQRQRQRLPLSADGKGAETYRGNAGVEVGDLLEGGGSEVKVLMTSRTSQRVVQSGSRDDGTYAPAAGRALKSRRRAKSQREPVEVGKVDVPRQRPWR